MSGPVPVVDYARTARRPAWGALPVEVPDLVGALCGSAVLEAGSPAGSGFTSGYAGLVRLADGREVFVKAGGPANNAHILPSYRREAGVLPMLPAGVPVPRLIATGETETAEGTYRVLVTAAVRGSMPGAPWTRQELGSVHEACLACATALTPPPAGLPLSQLAQDLTQDAAVGAYFPALAAGRVELTWGQPDWVAGRATQLAELVDRVPDALQGNTAGHGDLRADNVIVDQDGRAWLVDWNWLCVGPAWADFVGVLPLARADGIDVDAWLARSPLTADARPEDIDSWLAVVAAFMLAQADQPVWASGSPELRVHQRRYARTFLDWLGARCGWS